MHEETLEGLDQDVLEVAREDKHAIEEGGDRRPYLAQAAIDIEQRQPRRTFERQQRTALDLGIHDQKIELAQRIAGIEGFQIVLGPEHILPARLALAARDRPHRIEPPRDRRYEALLRLDVCDRTSVG